MPELLEYKKGARATWASGDYDAMMRQEGLYEVGDRIVELCQIRTGEVVLDVACGTGNATVPAARTGATVTGLDLTPELTAVGQQRAEAAGVQVEWREGDAEQLPLDDDSVDVVLSTFGVMFAPRHEVVADEIGRVLRPGGRLGIISWMPEGAIGEFFQVAGSYLPPMPDFVDPPLAWGDEKQVRELFEGTGIEPKFIQEVAGLRHNSVQAAVECYVNWFGPMVQARAVAEAEGRWPAMQADLVDLFTRHSRAEGNGIVFPGDYLVTLGRKSG